jgi:hypothetical protein
MMSSTKKVCVIGGGATGVSLLWCLSQDVAARQQWHVTLIHDQERLGGHSLAIPVTRGGRTFPIDIGVQFICPPWYPNVTVMLRRPEFGSVAMSDCDNLRISCAFPRGPDGGPRNWGNFRDYQGTERFALMTQKLREDAATFERTVNRALFRGLANTTLEAYFANTSDRYLDKDEFITHCLWPYLSIINGYGAHLMEETAFLDVIPLFAKLPFFKSPLGSFTGLGRGWRRFTHGATSWLDAMEAAARRHTLPAIVSNSKVRSVWIDRQDNNHVWVEWQDQHGACFQDRFDKVVFTTDMWTNAELLNNPRNEQLWRSVYSKYVDKPHWPLHPGLCYIHTDPSILSPDLRDQKEILQFTAYYSPAATFPYYDLTKSFTTYIQKNLLDDPGADGIYVTMYGYVADPRTDKVPAEQEVVFRQEWRHGM